MTLMVIQGFIFQASFKHLSMLGYLTKRLFIFLPTLLIISLIAFTLNNFGAGNPIDARLPPVGEGLDDFNYHEEAYYTEAHRLGLDRPLFYFDFTSAAYPDTLHKIVNRDKIATLKKLIGQYGNGQKLNLISIKSINWNAAFLVGQILLEKMKRLKSKKRSTNSILVIRKKE